MERVARFTVPALGTYLQITPYLPLPREHSPDGASPDWGCGHLIAAYYSFIYPERMKGWVGLVGWHTADGLPILAVTRQRRTGKVCLSETDVLPLCHATNHNMATVTTTAPYNIHYSYLANVNNLGVFQVNWTICGGVIAEFCIFTSLTLNFDQNVAAW